ncbi:MAG: integral rane protein MviN [Gemmatimonadetes bacterium]|nr:integral rane protein MviN [Gemmatimonadota bacterium]
MSEEGQAPPVSPAPPASQAPLAAQAPPAPNRSGVGAALVAAGILASRVFGLLRQVLMSRFLGAGMAADAFNAAFRIPNFLQNLFGEGALSASFIPVYARLLAEGRDEEADRVAGAVGALLAIVVASLVLAGVAAAPFLMLAIAPGWVGEKRELTIELTRILFPGAGLLVMSAWCLGILNSHRRFLLSYTAPVLWNVAMIAALLAFRHEGSAHLAVLLAMASVIGSALQFVVQLPTVRRVAPRLRLSGDRSSEPVRAVVRTFVPVFISRGVVQVSAYVDQLIASFLPEGMVSLLMYSATLYTLPVSLFGIAISAAELPEMARESGTSPEASERLRSRLAGGLRRIAFFVIPSAVAFLALGDVIVRMLFQGGKFTADNTRFTWAILGGSAVGLLSGTWGRLYSSAFYALRDTRTPLQFAILRVVATVLLGLVAALTLPGVLGVDARWGAAGLTASAGLAGWIEFLLLRRELARRVGAASVPARLLLSLWGSALVAAGVGYLAKVPLLSLGKIAGGAATLALYALVYGSLTWLAGVTESRGLLAAATRRFRR